ncbi:butyrophilin subfamily 2 member A1 isoform X5 [Salmo salar]|uniref:Butyrophilin subfamily 2 member A1 isoform X5 n=1 Tax=Salmo salar TaxID=8030 RepID=A0A1S3Q1P6_SALSA|nr:butyrophilin subfamily 2 member A1 isoform X5 [Salmo salar]
MKKASPQRPSVDLFNEFSLYLIFASTCSSDMKRYSSRSLGLILISLLLETVAVSNPVISINGTNGSGVVLKCEAKSWYPKPEMNWLDSERQVLPAGSAETRRDTEGLYIVRRHVTVNKKVTNTFTCRVQLQKFNFTRETGYNIPDEMFPTVPWVWIAVPVLIVCVCGLVFGFMWIKYQKLRKKIDFADQQIQELTDELDSSRIKSDQRIKELTDELDTREQELTEQLAKLKQERAALVSSVDNGCHRFSFSRTLSMSLSNKPLRRNTMAHSMTEKADVKEDEETNPLHQTIRTT